MASLRARTQDLFKKYGRVAVGCHFAVYFSGWAGCYLAIKRGVNVDGILHDFGLKRVPDAGEADAKPDADDPSWTRWLTGGGSTLALAFVANKALFPVRAPITITLTPAVARFLRSRAGASAGSVRR